MEAVTALRLPAALDQTFVPATNLPLAFPSLDPALHFISRTYDPKWLIKIAQNTDFERSSQVCILFYELSLYLVIFLLTGAF